MAKTAPKSLKSLPEPAKWLETALKYVPEAGWTPAVLAKAAASLKVDSALLGVIFPKGTSDLVALFHESVEAQMVAAIKANRGFAALKIRQKIAFAVRTRLELMAPHKEAVRRLFGWAAMPHNAPRALKMIWGTADIIWWQAGDTATDYNHYTKRLLLGQLYQRTLLFWLDDTSRGHTKTWNYLDERIDAVLNVGRKIGQLKDMAGMAMAVVKNRWAA